MPMLRLVSVLWLCFSLLACSSMQVVDKSSSLSSERGLAVGDHVRLTLLDGSRRDGELLALTRDTLRIRNIAGQEQLIQRDQLKTVEVQRFDGLKTTGLVVGIIVGVGAVLYALVMHAIANQEIDLSPSSK